MSDYQDALEAAGITVLDIEYFGSYQGEWVAKVIMPDGVSGYIHDYFGSCSVCDQFQADVGYEPWDNSDQDAMREYNEKVKQFGMSYLDTCQSAESLIAQLSEKDWNSDKLEAIDWIKRKENG